MDESREGFMKNILVLYETEYKFVHGIESWRAKDKKKGNAVINTETLPDPENGEYYLREMRKAISNIFNKENNGKYSSLKCHEWNVTILNIMPL